MEYMEVQYGIGIPALLDIKEDRELYKIHPSWMVKYAMTVPKISKLQEPVVEFLRRYTRKSKLAQYIYASIFSKEALPSQP